MVPWITRANAPGVPLPAVAIFAVRCTLPDDAGPTATAMAQGGKGQQQAQQHQQLREMTQSTGDMLRHMNRNGERLRMMMGDPAFQGDQQMQRQMEQLQNRWREMLQNADESVQIMERLQDRLGQSQGQ